MNRLTVVHGPVPGARSFASGEVRARHGRLVRLRGDALPCWLAVGLTAILLVAGGLGCAARQPPVDPTVYAAALAPPEPQTAGPDYRIGIGDELHIRFVYQPDQNEELPVRPDGRISLASTGQLDAVGLTPSELERLIEDRSSSRLREPEVTVVVTKVGPQTVYVGGEVARPGVVALQPGMTPLQAVMQTGGFRDTAKRDSVVLITPAGDGTFAASRVNMEQVLEDGVPERVRLRANEIVFVPKSWIGDMNEVVNLYVRGLIPVLPRVGVGYSLSNNN